MKKLREISINIMIVLGLLATPLAVAVPTYAAVNPNAEACAGTGGHMSGNTCVGNSTNADLTTIIKTIVNVLLYVLGALAVIMIIFGGVRYVISGGNQASVTGAKNTILYAVVGLVVALLAYAIVNFVLKSF